MWSRLHFLVKRHDIPYEVFSHLVTTHTTMGWRRNPLYHVYIPGLQNHGDSAWVTRRPLFILPINFPGKGDAKTSIWLDIISKYVCEDISGWEQHWVRGISKAVGLPKGDGSRAVHWGLALDEREEGSLGRCLWVECLTDKHENLSVHA